MKPKKTSLSDIAKSLEVSKTTVSFVMNDKGDQYNISKKLQDKIRAKAKELQYVPNYFARNLRKGETKTIGLVLPNIADVFYAKLCKNIQEGLSAHGYNTLIVNTNDNNAYEKDLMKELFQRSIDGMIIAPSNAIRDLDETLNLASVPVVFVDRLGDDLIDFVGINNKEETRKLVQLFSKMPKKVAVIAPEKTEISTIQLRIDGTREACAEYGIDFECIYLSKELSQTKAQLKSLYEDGFDSFIPLNSNSTVIALSCFAELNLKMSEDVSIISFGDNDVFQYLNPPISVLAQPIHELGSETVKRMMYRLQKLDQERSQTLLDCTFIPRGSH